MSPEMLQSPQGRGRTHASSEKHTQGQHERHVHPSTYPETISKSTYSKKLKFAIPIIIICLWIIIIYFNRSPVRHKINDDYVISPSDGKVTDIKDTPQGTQVGIFLSIFDVHTQYMPVRGKVITRIYNDGTNKIAFSKEAAHNVSLTHEIMTKFGKIIIRQKTGMFVRRLISHVAVGEFYEQGAVLGAILLGSRVEIVLPKKLKILVHIGEHLTGGVTPIALEPN